MTTEKICYIEYTIFERESRIEAGAGHIQFDYEGLENTQDFLENSVLMGMIVDKLFGRVDIDLMKKVTKILTEESLNTLMERAKNQYEVKITKLDLE